MRTRPAFTATGYRIRLIVGFTAVIGLLAGAWAWSLYAPLSAEVSSQQQARLTDLARAGAVVLSQSTAPLDETLRSLVGDSSVRLTVVASDGTVLADTQADASKLENHGNRPEIRAAFAGRTGVDVRTSDTQGIRRMYVAVPATYRGARVAMRASESLAEIAALSARVRRAGLLLLPFALLLATGLVWLVARTTVGPVERLARAARTMADGDLATPVPDEHGSLLPLSDALATLREQLRERLSALQAEEQTLRLALDGLSDGVLLLNGDRIRLANRAIGTMFRLPPGRLQGMSLAELDLPAPIESAISSRLGAPAAVSVDLGPDPFLRYHRVSVIPLGNADGERQTLVVMADQTDRMRLDAVRRDFVANASHELKTPTAAILLLTESAESAVADGDEKTALAFFGQIQDEADRLRRLVTELLDLSRIESVPNTEDVADVRRTLDLALAGHRRAATAKGLALRADLSAVAGADVAVRLGSTDLAIALDNLLSNAVGYTEAGAVTVTVTADERDVSIAVSDTGIGIPAADVERVFERFYRVDRARSRTSGGTGLGLALVRNIAEKADGSVTIDSAEGVGTTVTLRVPRAR